MFDWLRRRTRRARKRATGQGGKRLGFEGLEPRSLLSATVYEGGSFVAAATAALPANNIVVTGADAGQEPLVRVYDASGNEKSSFLAYAQAFRGGVRVAAGDVTGDGIPDIITGAGAGGGPQVRVFDGATGTRLMSFFAYDSTFRGGIYVAAGDVNGDGKADIITGAGAGGGPHVRVFDGVTGTKIRDFFAYDTAFRGGVRVAAGELNGDTQAEIITGAGTGGGPQVRVFDGATGTRLMSFFAYASSFRGGVFVSAGDVNGDTQVDIVTGQGEAGEPQVKVFSGDTGTLLDSDPAFSTAFRGGVRVAAADLDNDGSAEIVTGPGDGGRGRVQILESDLTAPFGDVLTPYSLPGAGFPQLQENEVQLLLQRATAASVSQEAIIAVVDRNGRILGVRVEQGVLNTITDPDVLVFAIDGAVAKARTAAFFANGDGSGSVGPLTSRTIRFISQSTMTQREIESNPNLTNDQTVYGPGFVAPVGVGGRFPPEVQNTPLVDLFAIEHTNRDSIVHPGANHRHDSANVQFDALGNVKPESVDGDDALLPSRFNIDPKYVPDGKGLYAPESYGFVSGRMTEAQSRGIGTLPGGIPLFRDTNGDGIGDTVVGGIGVFFPGPDGFATHEQGFIPGINQTGTDRVKAPKVLEAEFIALAAAGGSIQAGAPVGAVNGVAAVPGLDLPFGRIFLVGIDLETVGPHPNGVQTILDVGASLPPGDPNSGLDQPIDPSGTKFYESGLPVPDEWLVTPHAAADGSLSAADVRRIIEQGIDEANLVRSQIRLPEGNKTRMVLAVSDKDGNVLGLYRMHDSTIFSIDVAVAKSRNTAYYADPAELDPLDQVDDDDNGVADLPVGVAFSNRTFRFLAAPRFPSSQEGSKPGDFSILRNAGINQFTAENIGPALPASAINGVLAYDAFNPGTNFHDEDNILNQNGIVFFPGSLPLYNSTALVGGWGVSGDGVDQDDVVTYSGAQGYLPPAGVLRADQVFVRNVRLPITNFPRNPRG